MEFKEIFDKKPYNLLMKHRWRMRDMEESRLMPSGQVWAIVHGGDRKGNRGGGKLGAGGVLNCELVDPGVPGRLFS